MTNERRDYHALLLRIWRETPEQRLRIAAQQTGSDERIMLTNLDDLLRYLESLAFVAPHSAEKETKVTDNTR